MGNESTDDPDFQKALNDYLEVVIEREKAKYTSEIEPFRAYAGKLRAEMKEGLTQFQKTYSSGYKVLLQEIKKEMPEVDIASFQPNSANLALLDDPVVFFDFMAQGKTIADLLGFTPEVVICFYEAANRLLEAHHYQEALEAYFFLITISPESSHFWLDFGYCNSQLGHDKAAIDAYLRAIDIDPNASDSYLVCAGSFVKLQDFEGAKRIIEIGLHHAQAYRGEPWAESLGSLLEEAKRQIETLFIKSRNGTFAS